VKKFFRLFYKDLFLTNRLFTALCGCVVFFLFLFFFPWLGLLPELFFWTLMVLLLTDILMLYRTAKGVFAKRLAPERLSNGDENELGIYIENLYAFHITAGIID
jgi:uncharacterized protein (DUF58 family)